jgi:hypothetical protein
MEVNMPKTVGEVQNAVLVMDALDVGVLLTQLGVTEPYSFVLVQFGFDDEIVHAVAGYGVPYLGTLVEFIK